MTTAEAAPPLITRPFLLLLLAHFLQSLGWTSMILLPLYLDALEATRAEIGAIVAAAQIGGLVSRPAVGWALDTMGRKPTLIIGTVIAVIGMALIAPVDEIGPLIYTARVCFGVGAGALFTGYFTFAADIIPAQRRSEGIALFGVSGLLPMSISPLAQQAGVGAMDLRWFIPVLSVAVAISIVALLPLKEPAISRSKEPFSVRKLVDAALHRSMRPVWLASFAFSGLVVLFMSFAAVTAEQRGLENPSSLWLTYSAGAVAARLFGARLPDKVGPANMIAPAIGVYVVAALIVAHADTALEFLCAGGLSGVAHGYCFPVLTSQVITRTPERVRGSAMSLFTFLWDFTSLTISPALGLLSDHRGDGFMYITTATAAVLCLAAWAVLEHRASPGTAKPTSATETLDD